MSLNWGVNVKRVTRGGKAIGRTMFNRDFGGDVSATNDGQCGATRMSDDSSERYKVNVLMMG